MYNSTIIIDNDVDSLVRLLKSEDTDLGRSSFAAEKDDDGQLVITIRADDATAFKTVMNTLAKIFIVWEKTKVL